MFTAKWPVVAGIQTQIYEAVNVLIIRKLLYCF
jgi:hypothetical protein